MVTNTVSISTEFLFFVSCFFFSVHNSLFFSYSLGTLHEYFTLHKLRHSEQSKPQKHNTQTYICVHSSIKRKNDKNFLFFFRFARFSFISAKKVKVETKCLKLFSFHVFLFIIFTFRQSESNA